MKMQALLLSAEVGEISLYDISTGEYKPGFGVSAKVVDIEAGEPTIVRLMKDSQGKTI